MAKVTDSLRDSLAQVVALEDAVHAANAELCVFHAFWTLDGDYIRCAKCKRPQLSTYGDQDFPHASGCKAVGQVVTKPWLTYLSLMKPIAELHGPALLAVVEGREDG
mgnify:CR=1 FL=1